MTPRLAAALAVIVLAVPAPSEAAPLAMVGSGRFTPGLPFPGCVGGNVFSFTADAVSTPGPTVGTVRFSGSNTICESVSAGGGTGTFSGATTCRGVTYARTFFEASFSGASCALVCHLTPTSWNPWTTFEITCTSAIENSA